MSGPFGPPQPAFSNPTIEPQNFQPSNYAITSIAKSGSQISVTTQYPNNFVLGQTVRFHIPNGWGMRQLNELLGQITQINSTTNFLTDINPLNFDSFTTPGLPASLQIPQVSAVGDQNNNTFTTNLTTNLPQTISGAFQNISPYFGTYNIVR